MKRRSKKALSLLLALVLCLSLAPMPALAVDSGFTIENGVLTKYNGPGGDVVIPDGVTKIGEEAFFGCWSLTSVTIPNSVTEIGYYAFCCCTDLTSVTIPNSVTEIGHHVFASCTGLTAIQVEAGNPNYTSVNGVLFSKDMKTLETYPGGKQGAYTIPNSVTEIGSDAFNGCTGLTGVTIPNSITKIGNGAFGGCTGLTGVTIPGSVTSIEGYAFSDCTGLTSVTIPNSVTEIGYSAFVDCTSLTAIQVDAGNPNYTSVNGVLFTKDMKTLEVYPGGKQGAYSIPNSVTEIRECAFAHCTGLTSITIPGGIIDIGYCVFYGCTGLTSLDIPNNVTSFGGYAFADCTGLTNVTIPNSVTAIGSGAFPGCTGLTSVSIPNSVTGIGDSAFSGCTGLTSVIIPDSVTYIGGDAFGGCTGLKDVYYGGSEAQWGAITINGYNGDLTSATIHYNSPIHNIATEMRPEYIYDTPDPAGDMTLPAEELEQVNTQAQAVKAVENLTSSMTQTQKTASTGIDLATLYAETAAAKVSTRKVTGSELLINAAALKDLQTAAQQTTEAVGSALVSGGVTTARYVAKTATLSTSATGKITFRVDPDVLTVDVDKIRVETPDYAITLDLDELKPDLTGVLTFTAEAKEDTSVVSRAAVDAGGATDLYAAAHANSAVELGLPNDQVSNSVTLSMPAGDGDQTYKAVVNTSGQAASSKYNPATTNIDGKVSSSGTYKVSTNEVNFTDISGKSAEMQQAIRYLASKGIINGTSATTFSPNNNISRAEIAALLVRSLGWSNSAAVANFIDVTTNDWYYSAAASSQAHNLINGFQDGSFKGRTNIAKDQLVVVSSRVLKEKMGYVEPASTAGYLAKYTDSVAGWAQGGVALATRENLVVPRVDGTFKGAGSITRGDAAIIIYRLFQKIW